MSCKTIVVVEDEQDIRHLLMETFAKRGYEVHAAENGLEAVEMIMRIKPDLVVMDMLIPILQGHEVCRFVRSQHELRNVKILVLSSLMPQKMDRAQLSDAYLMKPARSSDVVKAAEGLLAVP